MPAKTKKQASLMRACAHPEGRKWAKENGVDCPPVKVAREFSSQKVKHPPKRP